jgi:hypothetical protein
MINHALMPMSAWLILTIRSCRCARAYGEVCPVRSLRSLDSLKLDSACARRVRRTHP